MRFGILGAVEAWADDGRPLAVGGVRLRALLALLVADVGLVVPAERLIDGVYGSEPPANATNALQSQISRLRQLLRDGPAIEFHPAGYKLAADRDDVDFYRFRQLAAEGHTAKDPSQAHERLGEALQLWRGDALADAGDAQSVRALATRLDEERLLATEDDVEAQLRLGHDPSGRLRALVAEHPLRERFRAQLMRALDAAGRPAEALTAFEDARAALAEELGTDPSAELAGVHLRILRRTSVPEHRLPAQLTSFVGRAEELDELSGMTGRLVTLTGPGGAGKTRLALEAAGRLRAAQFCPLDSLRSGNDVPQAILDAFGVREDGLHTLTQDAHPPAPIDRLVSALTGRDVLLVLDNCEHVIEAAAAAAERLLRACPALRILATSREPLGITGEVLYPVQPLATEAAVRLFADRASAVRPGFVVDETVARICRTLEGQPLAIELAAARLRTLPVGEIASRLDDRFRLLSRGSRTAPARHRTLRAAVEWSWDLLDVTERTLARRLTAFAGGAPLDAIAPVVGLSDDDVVDLLAGLVDKSLVELTGDRYRMLATVRAFGEERLAEAGETKQFRQAHAEYYLALAEQVEPTLRTVDQLDAAALLDRERDNLYTAVRWAIQIGDAALGVSLLAALAMHAMIRGRRAEHGRFAGELLDVIGGTPPPGLAEEHAMCVFAATLAGRTGAWSVVAEDWFSPDELYRPPRHPYLNVLSALVTGPPTPVQRELLTDWYTDPALDPWTVALGAFGTGYMDWNSGNLASGEALLRKALDGFRAIGERWGSAMALSELAAIADRRGDRGLFLAHAAECARLVEELGSQEDVAELLARRAVSSLRIGDLADAEEMYDRSLELATRMGDASITAQARCGLARLALRRRQLPEARRLAEQALAECPDGWYPADENRELIMVVLGRIQAADGDAEGARDWFQRALRAAGERHPPVAAEIAEGLAELGGAPDRNATLAGIVTVLRGVGTAQDTSEAYRRTTALTAAEATALLVTLIGQ